MTGIIACIMLTVCSLAASIEAVLNKEPRRSRACLLFAFIPFVIAGVLLVKYGKESDALARRIPASQLEGK